MGMQYTASCAKQGKHHRTPGNLYLCMFATPCDAHTKLLLASAVCSVLRMFTASASQLVQAALVAMKRKRQPQKCCICLQGRYGHGGGGIVLMGIPAIAMFCCGMSSLTSNSRYAHEHVNKIAPQIVKQFVKHLCCLLPTFREHLLHPFCVSGDICLSAMRCRMQNQGGSTP